jgi:hypothetical protein
MRDVQEVLASRNRPSETTCLLGYPPDARLLVINADDFGMCHAVNQAIVYALGKGDLRIDELLAEAKAWSERPDAFFALTQCAAVAWAP